MGTYIEAFQRTQKFDASTSPLSSPLPALSLTTSLAVLGGAEEILGDLGVRQASRKMPKAVL
jgi:hypothetical protein